MKLNYIILEWDENLKAWKECCISSSMEKAMTLAMDMKNKYPDNFFRIAPNIKL